MSNRDWTNAPHPTFDGPTKSQDSLGAHGDPGARRKSPADASQKSGSAEKLHWHRPSPKCTMTNPRPDYRIRPSIQALWMLAPLPYRITKRHSRSLKYACRCPLMDTEAGARVSWHAGGACEMTPVKLLAGVENTRVAKVLDRQSCTAYLFVQEVEEARRVVQPHSSRLHR